VTISNYPEGKVEEIQAPRHPQQEAMGSRTIFFSKTLFIDQEDFRESANKKYKRLVLGKAVRLRNAYVITCNEVVKDEQGNIIELICEYDDNTLGKNPEGYKPKGVIHWVSESHSKVATVKLYDRLFNVANPAAEEDFLSAINPDCLQVLSDARVEMSLAQAKPEEVFQFEREGYFCADRYEHTAEHLVFNRTVTLRDSWAKIEAKG